jgi:hypothetical protein
MYVFTILAAYLEENETTAILNENFLSEIKVICPI